MSLNFCDLLVLGSDLSGVMAATLLAKRGLSVLLLDDEADDDPSPNFVTGLDSRAFKSLLGKLMIPDAKLQIFHENQVGGQVIFPKHRIDLATARPLFLKEIEREFPEEKGAVEGLLAETDRLREGCLEELLTFLPVVERKERKRFLRFLKEIPDAKLAELWGQLSPTLQMLLRIQLRFMARGPLTEPLLLQLLLFLPPEGLKTFSIRGGARELKRLFFEKLDYFGGMTHPLGAEGFEYLTTGGEVRGIQLKRYDFPTRCRYLVGNLDLHRLYDGVPRTIRTYLKKREISRLTPLEERGLVVFRVGRDFLPAPMKENVVYVNDPAAPLEGPNYLEINLHSPGKGAEEGECRLAVTYRLPSGSGARDRSFFEGLNGQVESLVRRLIPFANEDLKRIFPTNHSEETLFPEERRIPIQVAYTPSLFGPPLTSPYKNMFSLGPNILDWLGMEGKLLAALRGIELVWNRELKTRNP